ncbi:MAG: DUF1828 domain-containing protein [Deltaproteobacteria bacterium]|nr:DUF1828 domain-containing protein [Deltaproteobacteria bacterium]
MNFLDSLRSQFNDHVAFRERRPGIQQLIAPLFYEDGDMVDIYLELLGNGGDRVRVCDFGMTLMRLSYSFDVDTPNKERIFQRILSENQLREESGNIFIETDMASLYPAVLQFAQGVAKVGNMRLFKREVIASLFYEMLQEFVEDHLGEYHPRPNELPLPDRDDLEVDFLLERNKRILYLFGVKDPTKARLITISCLEFQRKRLPFKSMVVHEDFEALPRKDRTRLTSACDKQFPSLDDFRDNALRFLEREVEA